NLFQNTLYKSSELFIILIFFELLYAIVLFTLIRLFKSWPEAAHDTSEENLPLNLILAALALSIALVFYFSAKEVMEYMVPNYINLRKEVTWIEELFID